MKRLLLSMTMMALAAGCGDDGASPATDAPPVHDASVDASPFPPCFSGTPTTHEQIINACTNAQQIIKPTTLPLLRTDGSLPPLPQ